ncbi:MAG: long-chain fatty acid--CoA ligase [Rhodobacteraceae bacterium]|nr:MAG: long-chain fatty acid--CoA ligase [Paracoccaceae bacterium]
MPRQDGATREEANVQSVGTGATTGARRSAPRGEALPQHAAGSGETFARLLRSNASRLADRPAYREKHRGIWRTTTWRALARDVDILAAALAGRGLKRGDHVAFLGENRPRLYAGVAAAHALGAVAMPLFPDATGPEIAPMLRLAGVTHAFVEDQEQVDKLLAILPECPALRCIVYDRERSMRPYRNPELVSYAALVEEGRAAAERSGDLVSRAIEAGDGGDAAFVFLNSGASGASHAAVLSHGGLIARARAAAAAERLSPADSTIAYLPPGWMGQAIFAYAQPMAVGYCVCCPESSETLLSDMREIAPTCFLTTPRMLDTIFSQVALRMEAAGGVNLALFNRAVALARRLGRRRLAGEPVGAAERMSAALYDAVVYGPLRDALGMSRVKVAYTSGDAVDPSILAFFRALGVNLKQLYGTTESGFLVAIQRDGAVRPDTVGAPLDGVETRISPDGEILVRAEGLFLGYLGDGDGRSVDAEGWLRTGDLGSLGADGQLRVADRAGDIGVLACGAAFAPRPIENRIKASPYVREAVVVGDGRDGVIALIDVNTTSVGRWADTHEIAFSGHRDLAGQDRVYDLVAGVLADINAELARDPATAPCVVRRFALLPEELSADDGVLTRTGKIRRTVFAQRFAPLIEAAYAGRSSASLAAREAEGSMAAGVDEVKIRDAALAPADRRAA